MAQPVDQIAGRGGRSLAPFDLHFDGRARQRPTAEANEFLQNAKTKWRHLLVLAFNPGAASVGMKPDHTIFDGLWRAASRERVASQSDDDASMKLANIERFCEVVIRPSIECLHFDGWVHNPTDHDDRAPKHLPQGRAAFDSRFPAQVDVQEDDGKRLKRGGLKRLPGAPESIRIVVLDGPSGRTRHLPHDELDPDEHAVASRGLQEAPADVQGSAVPVLPTGARVSGKPGADFPEPTRAS